MKKSIKSNFYGTIIFSVIILFFTGFSNAFGVENNVTIEGDSFPEIYSRELYGAYITPTEQSQKITLTIYGPTGKIASQTGFIGSGYSHHNFYVKFSPPLYKIDSKYTLEVTGQGLFGIKTITLQSLPKNIETKHVSSPSLSSLITIRTDSASYEQGDTIYISGTIPSYQQYDSNNQMPVSLQIFDSKNNIVTISQISSNSDNTYSTSVKGTGPMWKFAGEYTIRANFFQQNAFTTFEFSIPSTPITPTFTTPSKITTQLTLNSIPDSFEVTSSISKASVTFSGTLRMSDGTPISGEEVYVQDSRNNIKLKFQTNSAGKFSGIWKNAQLGNSYQMQAFYDGSDDTKPSKSNTESFNLKLKPVTTTPKPTFKSPSTSQDNSWIALIAVLAIIVVVIIVVKRRKSIGTSSKKQSTIQTKSGASVMSYYECPKCHSGNIQNNLDGSVNCPDCNFRV